MVTTAVLTYTAVPTGTSNPYPIPTYTINPTSTLPSATWVNLSPLPSSLPPVPDFANATHWRDSICNASIVGGTICPYVDSFTQIMYTLNGIVVFFQSIITAPLMYFVTVWNYVFGYNQTILSGWLSTCGVFISVIGQIVGALPDKVKGVITLIMTFDILKQITITTERI